MKPRPYLRSFALLLTIVGITGATHGIDRPNILLILGDNWAYPHASVYGDQVVKTPAFDALAREGVLFTRAFAPFPSCTPSRAGLLTGYITHRLESGANLYGPLAAKFRVYPNLLEAGGYAVGFTGKGWGPGLVSKSGRTRNPAGEEYKSFQEFLDRQPSPAPFCFWLGSHNPHVPWTNGQKRKSQKNPLAVNLPPHLPDHPTVRDDFLNYYCEVEELDREAGEAIALLRTRGLLDNTIMVMTSDNGMQMPRGLANCYDLGTHVPLAIRWAGGAKPGLQVDALVNLLDLAPTFLEAAGLKPPPELDGRSMLPLLRGLQQEGRDAVFVERERHANVRRGDLGYPVRGIRTTDFLYLRNLEPDRWPAGEPEFYFDVGPYGDVDRTPTKELLLAFAKDARWEKHFQLGFGKRPAEELYDLQKDPGQINNLAADPACAATVRQLSARVTAWMAATGDPRAKGATDFWDRVPYDGKGLRTKAN